MKTGKILLILGLSFILFSGCEKGIFDKQETLIFGKFHGFCIGQNCNDIYKLTSKNLFEDTKNEYIYKEDFKFEKLSKSKFEVAEHLLNEIPQELLEMESETIGCPDCADQGGYFIQYTDKEGTKTYKIDTFREKIPLYLHDYLNQIDFVLTELY